MTRQPKKDDAKEPLRSKRPRIAKETVKDLDAGSAGKDVKGGTTRRPAGAGAGPDRYC
jgi:hypothetical protein